ncbi:MAG: type II toxin-antitoxin system VapB family antitoxin [Chloroflexota bacterium]|nr:type II toxin-antitoxin system VapB family antitoxin [Chloroflexota bacterium]
MASTTIRISQRARDEARELARATGKPISQAVEEAIRRERRRLFWEQGARAVSNLRSDREALAEDEAETVPDGDWLLDGLRDVDTPE